jgi:hypothetical protein
VTRAQKAKCEGKAPTTQAGEFVREEIEHVRKGKHGARSTKQAVAIGLSKTRGVLCGACATDEALHVAELLGAARSAAMKIVSRSSPSRFARGTVAVSAHINAPCPVPAWRIPA